MADTTLSENNRLKIKTAVYVILEKQGKIFFLRRFNTGWSDGLWTLPAGHIDCGETPIAAAVRETKEETGVTVFQKNLQLVHVLYEKDLYIDFYFKAIKWDGTPKLEEVEKSDKVGWLNIRSRKKLIIPKVFQAINNYKKRIIYSNYLRSTL